MPERSENPICAQGTKRREVAKGSGSESLGGRYSQVKSDHQSLLVGPPEELAEIALIYGTSGFILAADDEVTVATFAGEVARRTRELVMLEHVRE